MGRTAYGYDGFFAFGLLRLCYWFYSLCRVVQRNISGSNTQFAWMSSEKIEEIILGEIIHRLCNTSILMQSTVSPLDTRPLFISFSPSFSLFIFFCLSFSNSPSPRRSIFLVVLLFHCLNALFSCGIFGQQIEQDSQLDVGYVNEISIWWASNTHTRARFVYIFGLIVFFSRLYFLSSFTIESLHEFSATFCDGIDGVCH